MFPWLSTFAGSFDSYRFIRLKFEYVPRCPTTTAGVLAMAFDYHVMDSPPVTERQMSMNWHCSQSPPYNAFNLEVDISKFHYKKYFTAMHDTAALETSDVGRLLIGYQATAAAIWGSLWVSYDLELEEPQQNELTTGGEVGDTRTTSLTVLDGPATTPGDWLTNVLTGGACSMVPIGDRKASYFVVPDWCEVDPATGWITLPVEWDYAKVDATCRGLVSSAVGVTSANFYSYCDCLAGAGTDGSRLTNLQVTTPWVGDSSTQGTLRASWAFLNKTNAIRIGPWISTALTNYAVKLGINLIISRLGYEQYKDLINP